MNKKEAIKLFRFYQGEIICDKEMKEAIDLAIKAIRIVDIIEACFKRDNNLMMDSDDWKDVKEEAEDVSE